MNTNRALNTWRDTWSPISDFLFDDFMPLSTGLATTPRFTPACEVEEASDHYLLSLEIPGVKKDDLKIEFVDNQVVISGERRFENKNRNDGFYYSERGAGKFQRSFTLPPGVDADKVEASYQDGILEVLVPKAESAKPRQIKITQGHTGSKFFGKFLNKPKEKEETHSSNEQREQVAS